MVSLADGTSKGEFELLADARIREARALFMAAEFNGARYLAGYSVECALKAIITKAIPAETLPRKKSVEKVHTHNLVDLLGLSGKRSALEEAHPDVRASWTIVVSWSEVFRYEHGADRSATEEFLTAIDDPAKGVLQWLKAHW